MAYRDSLAHAPNVSFVQHDLLEAPLPKEKFKTDKGFDLVTGLTMAYQLEPQQRVDLIESALNMCNPNGFVVIQDFIYSDPAHPMGMNFHENWGKHGSYAAYIIGERTGRKPVPFVRFDNGRCMEIMPDEGFAAILEHYGTRI